MFLKKAVFLDRDGVINKLVEGRPPWHVSEVDFFEDIFYIIELIKMHKYIPVIVTNQPDALRGNVDLTNLQEINNHISKALKIKNNYTCFHPYDNMCTCRKPKPGMIIEASKKLNIDTRNSFLVGDREKDIQAGNAAGCKTIFLSKDFSSSAIGDHSYNDMALVLNGND